MSNSYHISPKTGKAAICSATVRGCRYEQHFSSIEEAAAAIIGNKLTHTPVEGVVKPPIIVSAATFGEPYSIIGSFDYDYEYYGADYEDSYGDDETSDEGNGYNSYSVYSGLELISVNANQTVRNSLHWQSSTLLPDDLMRLIDDNNWNDIKNWDIEAEGDYYGENVVVIPPADMLPKLREWFIAQPNADDIIGVFKYVRSKGTETVGLTPMEAIKKQLAEENPGRSNSAVEKASTVSLEQVKFDDIVVPHPKRLVTVEGRNTISFTGEEGFAGVVVRQGRRFVLVDGYHRLRFFLDGPRNCKQANYLVLY